MSKVKAFQAEVRRRGLFPAVRTAVQWLRVQRRARNPAIQQTVASHNQFYFDRLGVGRDAAESRYKIAAEKAGVQPGPNDSIHRLAFAALAVSGFAPRTILELGTSHADTTIILAELFPDAQIYTVELPDDDPIYNTSHPSHDRRNERASRLLDYANVRQIRVNSMWLMSQDLPDFDLIWLDAGHNFPEVAWDHSYCVQKLRSGGWLFTDDVMKEDSVMARKNAIHSDVWKVASYINMRLNDEFFYLLKRENSQQYVKNIKYVGGIRKTSNWTG